MRLAAVGASFAAFASVAIASANPLLAAEGDRWTIDREDVNVRSGPSTNTEVLMTINPGANILEIAAKGDWYFVEFPEHGTQGWIYGPLLVKPGQAKAAAKQPEPREQPAAAPAAPAPAPTVTAAPAAPPKPLETVVAAVTKTRAITPVPEPAAQAPEANGQVVAVDQEPAAVKSFRETVSELNDRAVTVAGINLFNDVRSLGGGGVQVLATETWATVPEAGQSSYMNALFDRWQSVANGLGPVSLQIVDPAGKVMMERSGS